MINRLFYFFNVPRCPKCFSKSTKETVKDRIDYLTCEFELTCSDCGNFLNYWAYGNYEIPIPSENFWDRINDLDFLISEGIT